MKDYQKDIENVVLPSFLDVEIGDISWGEWIGPFVETAVVAVSINNKPYILVEIDNDILPKSDSSQDIEVFFSGFKFSDADIKKIGFLPKSPLTTKKPVTVLGRKLPIVTSLEVEGGRTVDYMLFTEK